MRIFRDLGRWTFFICMLINRSIMRRFRDLGRWTFFFYFLYVDKSFSVL